MRPREDHTSTEADQQPGAQPASAVEGAGWDVEVPNAKLDPPGAPASVDPISEGAEPPLEGEAGAPKKQDVRVDFARDLERELRAADAELATDAPQGAGDSVAPASDRAAVDAPVSVASVGSSEWDIGPSPPGEPVPGEDEAARTDGASSSEPDDAAIGGPPPHGTSGSSAADPLSSRSLERSPPEATRRDEAEGAPIQPAGRRFKHSEILGGKYRLERSLARGGMGWVYLATQLPLGRRVAVKVVMPQVGDQTFRQRFLLEASICAKLSHPNIVTIYDFGQTKEGDVYMAMEYLQGRSLARTMVQERRLDPDRASRLVFQIARALRAAHRAGVVHRDLKPANVMLLPDSDEGDRFERVKVVDFGLAKLYESPNSPELTRAGMMLGSPRYMSPEQIRNRGVDPRTDIYSLGIIFYLMLTGRPPFDGESSNEILTQHLRDPVPPMHLGTTGVVVELESIIRRCLEKRPEDRFQTIDELLTELKLAYRQIGDHSGTDIDLRSAPVSASQASAAHALSMPIGGGMVADSSSSRPIPDNTEHRFSTAIVDGAAGRGQLWWAVALVLTSVIGTLVFWALILE